MKKHLLIIVLSILIISINFCFAETEELIFEDFSYTILADKTAEIHGYLGEETELAVPSEIDGIAVSSIGDYAFNRSSLTSVSVPEGIISIGALAFGESVDLQQVMLPDGLLSIGDAAFQGCISLESPALPASLVKIGWNPFDRCDSISAIDLPEGHPFYSVEDGVLFDSKSNAMVTYPAGKTDSEYTVPEWVTSIGMAAFSENKSLETLNLPENLSELGGNPFCGCTALSKITVSYFNQVFEVRNGSLFNKQTRELIAYLWGSDTDTYSVPTGTVKLAREAFYKHTELKSVSLPKTLTIIDDAAFAESGLISIEIPESVVALGNSTFSACADLTSVSLPSGLTWIGNSVFYECTALETITLPKALTSIGTAAFMHCEILTEIVLPEELHFIGDYAFALCPSLTSVDFQDRIFSIGRGAFYGAEELTASVYPDSLALEWAITTDVSYTLKNVKYIEVVNI